MHQVLVLNGPNLNLLGVREPEIYGHDTLETIRQRCEARAKALSIALDFRQSNHEGELIEWVQEARSGFSGLLLNAAAFTHTSAALHDALKTLSIPIIEVHLSNPHAREPFRAHSFVSPVARGIISGFGAHSYELALEAIARMLSH